MKPAYRPVLIIAALMLAMAAPARLAPQDAPTEPIVLRGPTFGGVKFVHLKHADVAECAACHHEARPEMPMPDQFAGCRSCHTDVAEAPIVTNSRDAFHDRRAKQGLCVDCHTTKAAEGVTTPARCADCHKDDQG